MELQKQTGPLIMPSPKSPARMVKAAAKGTVAAVASVPNTITGLCNLGFRIGIFLILKSYLVLFHTKLAFTGYCMVVGQLILALIFIMVGTSMQDPRVANSPRKARTNAYAYLFGALLGYFILFISKQFSWNFFAQREAVNWFVDALNTVRGGLGEISMSILFCDQEFWSFFSLLLFFITEWFNCSLFGLPFSKSKSLETTL